MTKGSRSTVLGFCSGATALILGSVAWACTAVPSCSSNPDSGPMGTRVSINCIGFERQAPVEIRWNSVDGPVVGNAMASDRDGSFTVAISPPAGSPAEVHYITAVQRRPDGTVGNKASDVFELTVSGSSDGVQTATGLNESWASLSSAHSVSDDSSLPEYGSSSRTFALGMGLLALSASLMAFAGIAAVISRRPQRSNS